MDISQFFPIWSKLSPEHRAQLSAGALSRSVKKGTILHNGSADCAGLILVHSGQLRAYILSPEGRELTVYRLFDWDICLFSAACVMNSLQFDIMVEAEKDTDISVIPPYLYKKIVEESAPLANYTNDLMGSRFTEVMWLIEQVLWKSMDKRLADFLLEEAAIEETKRLKITHEAIANHLGTHREVITRMLRYFQQEGTVALSRGVVEITDQEKLQNLRE